MSEIIVSPSILSSDFANLKSEIESVSDAEWIHIDVMDGHFVPNITIGAPVVKSLRKATSRVLDVHLMIDNPKKYIPDFIKAGADLINFHIEAAEDSAEECTRMIKDANLLAGISIKPKTPVEAVLRYLNMADMILVMTVEPGFSGQTFIKECVPKISKIRQTAPNLKYIQVDGGINEETAKVCHEAGANCFVAGNYIFGAENRNEAVKKLRG